MTWRKTPTISSPPSFLSLSSSTIVKSLGHPAINILDKVEESDFRALGEEQPAVFHDEYNCFPFP
jgi:hypothetical protein